MRPWLFLGAVNGLLAVAAGAYGWHGLAVADSGLRDVFLIGVAFHLWHALALAVVDGVAARGGGSRMPTLAGIAFTAGIVLFSGSLYALAIIGSVPVVGAAPVGGVCLMAGWALLAACALRRS